MSQLYNLIIVSGSSLMSHTFTQAERNELKDKTKPCFVILKNGSYSWIYTVCAVIDSTIYLSQTNGDTTVNSGVELYRGVYAVNIGTGICTFQKYIGAKTNEALVGTEPELKELTIADVAHKVFSSEQFYQSYSASSTYALGDIVSYKGKFYICIAPISVAQEWTGANWAETNPGQQVVEITNSQLNGYLTNIQLAKACSENCVIVLTDPALGLNRIYYKYGKTTDSYAFYVAPIYNMNSSGTLLECPELLIYKSNRYCQSRTLNTSINNVTANPTLAGTESTLVGLQVGNTKYTLPFDKKLDKDNFGWAIADHTYDPTYAYSKGDTVYYIDESAPYRGYLYVANQDIAAPAGAFDYAKWDTTTLERLIWYKQDKLPSVTTADKALVSVGTDAYEWRDVDSVNVTTLYKHLITIRTEDSGEYAYLTFELYDDSPVAYNKTQFVQKYAHRVFESVGNVSGQGTNGNHVRSGIMRFSVEDVRWSGVNSSNVTITFWVDEFDISQVVRIGTTKITTEVDNAMSSTSENPVQNKIIKAYVDGKETDIHNWVLAGNYSITGPVIIKKDPDQDNEILIVENENATQKSIVSEDAHGIEAGNTKTYYKNGNIEYTTDNFAHKMTLNLPVNSSSTAEVTKTLATTDQVNAKQDTLTAGVGIDITNNNIKAIGVEYKINTTVQQNALKFVKLTQAQYDAIQNPDADTLYIII